MTVNVVLFDPAAIDTLAGTVADGSLEVKLTVAPPVGVLPAKVTVPIEETPPNTDVGLSVRVLANGASIRRPALTVCPLAVADIVAVSVAVTGTVVTVNDAVVAPAKTVTLAGTVAAALFEDREITSPPAGAGFPSVTVPTDEFPPSTDVPTSTRLFIVCGVKS